MSSRKRAAASPPPANSWRNRIVGHGEESPEQLLANPRNWRIHPTAQQQAMTGALDEVGWVQQIIVNRTTGFVVDGHLRVALAISRGEASVPVVYVELTPDEEGLVLASLDPIAGMAKVDADQLAELLAEITVDDEGLRALLAGLGAENARGGLTDPDEVPDVPDEPYVRRGEVYALGRHRLMCGDATSADAVAVLLEGAKPGLCVTDPPYGVNYDPAWRQREAAKGHLAFAARRVGEVANDDRADWREAWALVPGSVLYVWHGGIATAAVVESIAACGFEPRAQIIWAKPHFPIGRGHYHWRHEPCWYAVRKGGKPRWIGGRKQTTVWRDDREPTIDELRLMHRQLVAEGTTVWEVPLDPNVDGGHSTQKPVECMERPLRNHEGDVYDPFVGSGTSIIAAERVGRSCFAMDISEKYVQVALERWERFTGQKAERVCG